MPGAAKDFQINILADDAQARQVFKGFEAVAIGAAATIATAWAKAQVTEAFAGAADTGQANARLAASLGATADESARWGAIAGDVWSKGFADRADVDAAISAVRRNIGNFADGEMTDLVTKATTLSDVMEQDVIKTTGAAGALLRNGLAKDADQAFDITAAGLQSVANQGDDLLDTFIEYSPFFRKLGLDGQQSLGLLSQGMAAGARNSDFLADALKEFVIRGQEPVRRSTADTAAAMAAAQQAGESLARAQRDETRAQEGLNAARQQAVRDLDALADRLAGSQLSERGAELAVQRAQERLKAVGSGNSDTIASAEADYAAAIERQRSLGNRVTAGEQAALQDAVDRAKRDLDAARSAPTPSGLDAAEAKLAYDQAVFQLEQQRKETRALADEKARADQAGVEGSQGVQSAQDSLANAQKSVTEATDAAAKANANAADDSTALGKAYRRLGIDGEWAAAAIASGGPDAQRALQMVRDGLLGVTDPVERNALAVQLFGTKAEDLQGALYAMNPSTAVDSLGRVAGASQQLATTIEEGPQAQIEAQRRAVQNSVTDFLEWSGVMGDAGIWVAAFGGDVLGAVGAVGGLAVAIATFRAAQTVATAATVANTAATVANNAAWYASPVTWIILAIIVAIGLLVAAVVWLWTNWDDVTKWMGEAWTNVSTWIGDGVDWVGGKVGEVVGWFNSLPLQAGVGIASLGRGLLEAGHGIATAFAWLWNNTVGAVDIQLPGFLGFPGAHLSVPDIIVPALASGGVVLGPTLALIGEAGPEAVVPLSRASEHGFGGGGGVTHVVLELDRRVLYEAFVKEERGRR
ncbi:phage tail tape measure protein [Microbacterium sp. 5K110]|jgi:hypothetical protein|uniref:phage tail tape measure protein n=1 Tax=unclassified Microbacterium TaxID=2609290 RepID=UPI0010FDF358|nr:phage tail tape measure protein [Microbacterium sp. 5K110]TLF33968.1 hypothetical protein FE256_02315 [Microbacterium sp. 5K110]